MTGEFTGSQVFASGLPDAPGTCKQISGQELFWSLHHWPIQNQIMIGTHTRSQDLTFGCVVDLAGINGLADSKLGEGCDGNCNE